MSKFGQLCISYEIQSIVDKVLSWSVGRIYKWMDVTSNTVACGEKLKQIELLEKRKLTSLWWPIT